MLRNIAISDSVSMFLVMLPEHALYIYELCLLVTIIQTKQKKMMRFKIKHNYFTNCAPLITHSAFSIPFISASNSTCNYHRISNLP